MAFSNTRHRYTEFQGMETRKTADSLATFIAARKNWKLGETL
jgi:hypothetical protein